eukprot:scaffold1876_cov209-Chaetoceros_neogracile.AAC.1
MMRLRIKRIILILSICLSFLSNHDTHVHALEATFTAAPDKDTGSTDGPLPQSQKHRNQLMELDQQIAQSPNPTETLQQVADANGIDPTELGDMLMRNRRDMQMAEGGAGGAGGMGMVNSLPRKMIRLFTGLCIMAMKSSTAHPRSATLMSLAFLSVAYVIYSAPRNGILISGGRGGVLTSSSGMTTILSPPTQFLSDFTMGDKFDRKRESMVGLKGGALSKLFDDNDDDDDNEEEGVHVPSLSKKEKKKISLALVARKTVPFEVLLPSEEELELLHEKEKESREQELLDDEELMRLVEEKAWQDSIELVFNSAVSIIAARRFTEFIASPSHRVKFVARGSGNKKDKASLVVKSMGDWMRYGIQPLKVAAEETSTDFSSVIYYTLQGGHFDGELKISVEKDVDGDSDSDPSITVIVTLLIAKGGRKLNTKLASKMVTMLADSITTSTLTAARQTLSRKMQSTIYRGKARSRATEKRHFAFDNMQKMEEMAEDRRRKWQRNNKGSGGSYRPTGIRPPGGGPRFGC